MKVIVKKPDQAEIDTLGINNWATWSAEVSEFDWEYTDKETCYILSGKVKVNTPDGEVSFGKGDLVIFPKGLKCTWKVIEPVKKHYKFG